MRKKRNGHGETRTHILATEDLPRKEVRQQDIYQ